MLDVYQKQFCESWAEDIRLLAPAGSGKTHSLLWRCKSIYERKRGSARFLIVTFTRAARDELRKRLGENPEFADLRSSVEVATLNAWGYRRVRQNHHSAKLHTTEADRSFCVQNALQPVWQSNKLIKGMIEHQKFAAGKVVMNIMDLLKSLGFNHQEKAEIQWQHVERLKDQGLFIILEAAIRELRGLGVDVDGKEEKTLKEILKFWSKACDHLISQSLFTLEDQKYVCWLDLIKQIEAGKKPLGGARYTNILVDEFQDVNPLDLSMIKSITALNDASLVIVGDDDQAIFEWRGATFKYIVDPEKYLSKKFETFILERNYRCPANIVDHSQRLIKLNKNRVKKNVEAVQQATALIEVRPKPTFHEAIDEVVSNIEQFRKDISEGKKPAQSRLALISRKRAQLIPYQILLASQNIPFCAAEDLQVFLSKAFDSLIEVLTICADARGRPRPRKIVEDVLTLCDVVKRYPLSKSDKAQLESHLNRSAPRTYDEALDALSSYSGELKKQKDGRAMAQSFVSAIRPILRGDNVSDILDAVSQLSGMEKDYGKSNEDIFFADPPFFYLSRFAARYGDDLERFIEDLEEAKRQTAQVPVDDDEAQQNTRLEGDLWSRPIHLMTALRAKGKEFDTVVMLDVNDGIWPSVHAETENQKEQERRLFYVAMTRAKSKLVMTLSGRIDDKVMARSPFIAEAGID